VSESLYRPARPARPWWNVVKTLLDIALFWFIALIALPIGVAIVEIDLAIQRFPGFPQTAAVGFALFAALGLWAALTLAIAGRGTPLPMDEARRLVVTGPYAHVRNPLVISLLGQGTAFGLAMGSVPVLLYVAALAAWLCVRVRRREERHLAKRFGKAWTDYSRNVRAYRPRLSPYKRD
jgi:protein-S-isoprenylcysteine O-methyltransferase Ste14